MRIGDFRALVKKPGKIVLPVNAGEGVIYIAVIKSDLLYAIKDRKDDEKSPWKVYGIHDDGSLLIDTV